MVSHSTRSCSRRSPGRPLLWAVVTLGLMVGSLGCSSDSPPAEGPTDPTATDVSAPEGTDTTVASPRGDNDPLAAALDDPEGTGRELAQRFLDILRTPNPAPLLDEFLSPAFQLQRSNGTFANKDEYVDQPASVARFTILDDGFRAFQEGPALTVRFRVTIEEEIGGQQLRVTDADRLGVFIRTSGGWKLLAWSNFNPVSP